MVMLAERQRSMREAEEKGKREEEEKRRATQDEMYRQIMQVLPVCCCAAPRVRACSLLVLARELGVPVRIDSPLPLFRILSHAPVPPPRLCRYIKAL